MTFDAILRPRSDEQAASCRGIARSPLLPGLRPMARLTSCSEDGWPGREAEQDQRLCATAVAFPPPCERAWQRGAFVVHSRSSRSFSRKVGISNYRSPNTWDLLGRTLNLP